MVRTSSLVVSILIISLVFTLILPFKFIQFIALSLVFIVGVAFLYAKIIAKNIKVERNIKELKLACNEEIELSFSIKNYSALPVFICYYSDTAPFLYVFQQENSGIISLRPREIKYVNYRIQAQYRGLYPVGPVKISASDPLGLFEVELELPEILNITVRPARIKLRTNTIPGFPQGFLKITNPVYEDITMRKAVREYRNGDELKRINWRLSAKFGELFTNMYEQSYDAPFFVFLNLAEDDYDFRNRTYYSEKAIEIAAAIVETSRKLKQNCGFAAFSADFPYLKPRQNQADAILDILSLIKPAAGKLPYNPYLKFKHQLPAGTLLFVVGPGETERYYVKAEAGKADFNTTNLRILKRNEL